MLMVTQLTHIKLRANKNKTIVLHLYCEKQYEKTYIYTEINGTIRYNKLPRIPNEVFLQTYYNDIKQFLYYFQLFDIKAKEYKLRLTYNLDLIIDYTKNKWRIIYFVDEVAIYESTQMKEVIILLKLITNYYEQVG